uniref:t-SNARE coiled-coil homology domain-containing protein n=1 Tax=Globodera rostochiensis TaxID=31243 RepID=A0A914HF53_GLORO
MLHLVYSQGVLVDNIESNVQSATDFVGHARVQVNRAVVYKKSAQRLKCAIVLALVVLLLVLFLLLIFLITKFLPSGGSH